MVYVPNIFFCIEEKHKIDDGVLESINSDIREIKEEYMAIEKKSSQYEVRLKNITKLVYVILTCVGIESGGKKRRVQT